jgi:hypothetical protein
MKLDASVPFTFGSSYSVSSKKRLFTLGLSKRIFATTVFFANMLGNSPTSVAQGVD